MDFCVLGLLMQGPASLYELNSAFARSLSLFYRASLGSLQAALRKLLGAGYVEIASEEPKGRRKRIYRIREEGRVRFLHLMGSPLPKARLEETALARYYFLGLLPSPVERAAALDRIIADASTALSGLESLSAEISALDIPPEYREIFRYQAGTLEYGLAAHRTALGWFRRRRAEERMAGRSGVVVRTLGRRGDR
ncbi:MAG TPA: PadR family transcriptional regulator [Magnetospirillaceae bacterium]|nr:PadR family transcriptional regulator [Magnetospirillaceae bacterium]